MAAAVDAALVREKFAEGPGRLGTFIFSGILLVGAAYVALSLGRDLSTVHGITVLPFVLLGVALMVALGFEFVNGFHDTAEAVATVIYTHSLEPHFAVAWSGTWNLIGVLTSSGVVAFAIVALLPVELILQVGSSAGFAMVFALLVAAIMWNLGTWYLGLPASSSHTLIGSIIGVGVANQLLSAGGATSGVDWSQAANVAKSLIVSPIIGFLLAGLLLTVMRALIKDKKLYTAPAGIAPPPFWIRALLILTCTGVSFAHGSNDGQKGMGLIMLILVGTVPTAYALNHAITPDQTQDFVAVSKQAADVVDKYVDPRAVVADPRGELANYLRSRKYEPAVMLALRQIINEVGDEIAIFKSLASVPDASVRNFRNDMYLTSETLRLMQASKQPQISLTDWNSLLNYKRQIDAATRFIPPWVKVAVALALGLGTMVGWQRIVITVGEKIGKEHLTYGQGAAAEIITMATISGADYVGLPVSTTHVLSSGIAGTMAANRSGLQFDTIRNILMAWVLTLPAAMMLSGFLFWIFRSLF